MRSKCHQPVLRLTMAVVAALSLTSTAVARGSGGSGGSHSHSSGSHSSASHSHAHNADGLVHVRGYYRSNGTYVQPHTRGYPSSYIAGYRGTSTGGAVAEEDDDSGTASSPPASLSYRTTARTAARTSYSTGRGSDSPPLLAAKFIAIFSNHKHQPIVSYEDEDDGYRLNFVNGGHGHYPLRMIVRFDSIDEGSNPVVNTDAAEEETVYVSPTGTEYHLKGCRLLSLSQMPMKLSEAKAKYTACPVCRPPE